MPKKLILSEAFVDDSGDIIVTTRVPKSLHSLLEKEAQERGASISTLVRSVLSSRYLAEYLKSKSKFAGNDSVQLEVLRIDLIGQLNEIEALSGKKDDWLEKLIEKKIKEVFSHQKKGGKEKWKVKKFFMVL